MPFLRQIENLDVNLVWRLWRLWKLQIKVQNSNIRPRDNNFKIEYTKNILWMLMNEALIFVFWKIVYSCFSFIVLLTVFSVFSTIILYLRCSVLSFYISKQAIVRDARIWRAKVGIDSCIVTNCIYYSLDVLQKF